MIVYLFSILPFIISAIICNLLKTWGKFLIFYKFFHIHKIWDLQFQFFEYGFIEFGALDTKLSAIPREFM